MGENVHELKLLKVGYGLLNVKKKKGEREEKIEIIPSVLD